MLNRLSYQSVSFRLSTSSRSAAVDLGAVQAQKNPVFSAPGTNNQLSYRGYKRKLLGKFELLGINRFNAPMNALPPFSRIRCSPMSLLNMGLLVLSQKTLAPCDCVDRDKDVDRVVGFTPFFWRSIQVFRGSFNRD